MMKQKSTKGSLLQDSTYKMLKRNREIKKTVLLHVLTAVTMKSTPCSLMFTDILEKHAVSKFRLALLA
jgi:hypothetical protein